jgi:hypothetical protein
MSGSSSRLISVFNQKSQLWWDSETESSSIEEVPCESISPIFNSSLTSSQTPMNTQCCLICSMLPSLSHVNCCSKHLNLLKKGLRRSRIYMIHPAIKRWRQLSENHRHRRRRQIYSSSSSMLEAVNSLCQRQLPQRVRYRS